MPSGAVTFAVTLHEPLNVIAPPVRLMVPDPAVAVAVPPQVELNPLGLATVMPEGSESVKPIPLSVVPVLGFEIENDRVEVRPGTNFGGMKNFVIEGGATTVMLAVPGILLAPPLVELTATELF